MCVRLDGDLKDTLILGAGPAGLQLACHLERAGVDYAVLDGAAGPGSFFSRHPRHRTLLSINKVHTGTDDPEQNLRWDWNSLLGDAPADRFGALTRDYFPDADDLVRYLEGYAARHRLRIRYRTRVVSIDRPEPGGPFHLEDASGLVHRARRLVVATGVAREHVPAIPGVEHAEGYADMPTDPAGFAGQRVLILGKGNSAFETANALTPTASAIHVCSPEPLEHAWRSHFVGHLRAVNNDFLDTYLLKSQNAVLNADVEAIARRADGRLDVRLRYTRATDHVVTIRYDRVLRCTGFRFDPTPFAAGCRPELTACGRLPRQTERWESTSVPGLFFAGVLMAARDYKKTMSAFIHGFRQNVLPLARILTGAEGAAWPAEALPAGPADLADAVLDRFDRSAAMFLQPGFLGELVRLQPDGSLELLRDLPVDYVRAGRVPFGVRSWLLTLEYGPTVPDPLRVERDTDPAWAASSPYLHPVLRSLDADGREGGALHLLEDLENVYTQEPYRTQLADFWAEELARARGPALAT